MFPAATGTLSAMLAKNGVPGFDEPFNGKAGFFLVATKKESLYNDS